MTRCRPAGLALALAMAALAAGACTASRHQTGAAPTPGASGAAQAMATRSPSPTPSPTPTPATLPRGGRTILPRFQVVAFYGSAGGPALGTLGRGTPEEAAARLERQAAAFRGRRPVLPAFEFIATVASASPGPDGSYSSPVDDATIGQYLTTVRRHRMIMILDLQPGRSDFLPQAHRLARWLRQPDVSIALDPEWKLQPGELPARQIGSTDAASINAVSAYVAGIVRAGRLPQKLFVLHQFRDSMIRNRPAVLPRPGLAMTFHVDGFGGRSDKLSVYAALHRTAPFFNGFKLFYTQDVALFGPREVLAFRPPPDLVSYQ